MTNPQLSAFEQSIIDNVAKHGCFILSVFDPDEIEPSFSYSIGFPETVAQPEVVVFSLPKNLRASMINELWRQMSVDGLALEDGVRIAGLIEGVDCVARRVTSSEALRAHFGSAFWYHRTQRNVDLSEAYQIVWPGAQQGLFPWESGCAQEVIDDQPALYDMMVH